MQNQTDLAACVDELGYIDGARAELGSDPLYKDIIEVCHAAIFKLCLCYEVGWKISLHSLMISNAFISTNAPLSHLSPTAPFEMFWTSVGMVCFTLSMNLRT